MKRFLFCFFVLLSIAVKAQINLVPNPSFEAYDTCPSNVGEVARAISWNVCGNTPDYFNTCATSTVVEVPNNAFGYQIPASGNAYCGLYTFGSDYREFLGARLTTPLGIGQKYFVSFKVSRSNDVGAFARSTNKQGALFTTVQYSQSSPAPVNNFAHIYSNSIISDSLNWTEIFGSFVSDSAYQYILLGNFFDDANTDTLGGLYGYYYIDNICVSTDSLYAATWTGIHSPSIKLELKIYPNPANDFFIIESDMIEKPFDLNIYNSLGEILYSEAKIKEPSKKISVKELHNGILHIQVISDNQINYFTILKL
jgi:OOP family OmpA-OmpF porin